MKHQLLRAFRTNKASATTSRRIDIPVYKLDRNSISDIEPGAASPKLIIGWVGSFLGSAGALLVALNVAVSGYGYLLFTSSSILMCLYALYGKDKPVLFQNLVFTIINSIGVYRWLLAPYM